MILADLHVHSNFSDGKHSIPEIIDLFGSRGFGVIAITDHLCESNTLIGKAARYIEKTLTPATFPIYMEILKTEAARAWDQYRMIVIPGIEFTKNSLSNNRSAHILGLGITQFISADIDVVSLARSIRSQGGVAVVAHPVSTRKMEKQTYYLWNRRKELAQEFDAWEVASGPYIFDEVLKANLPKIANSDLHKSNQINSWKTVFHCDLHIEAILTAIRKQNIDFRFYNKG